MIVSLLFFHSFAMSHTADLIVAAVLQMLVRLPSARSRAAFMVA